MLQNREKYAAGGWGEQFVEVRGNDCRRGNEILHD